MINRSKIDCALGVGIKKSKADERLDGIVVLNVDNSNMKARCFPRMICWMKM